MKKQVVFYSPRKKRDGFIFRVEFLSLPSAPLTGEVLREFMPSYMSIGEVAARLGVSRPHLSRLLNGHTSMTAEMSIKIGLLTGTSPESWLYNQVQYDLWREFQKPLPKVEPLQLQMAA